MPGTEAFIGPFQGGLNTLADPSAVAPNEVIVADNFDIDITGALKARAPFADSGAAFPVVSTTSSTPITGGTPDQAATSVAVTGGATLTATQTVITSTDTDSSGDGSVSVLTQWNPRVLGWYNHSTMGKILIASDGKTSTYYLNPGAPEPAWTLITASISASCVLQFYSPIAAKSVLWLFSSPGVAQTGGWWNESTFTADANMPPAVSVVSFRDRMWVATGTDVENTGGTAIQWYGDALYMSWDIDTAASQWANEMWPTTSNAQYIRIQAGDGQKLVAICEYMNSIVLFKTKSIYSYTFYGDPFDTGYVQNVMPATGLENRDAFVQYDNYIYFLYGGYAYEYLGGRVDQISTKVVLTSANDAQCFINYWACNFGKRILFGVNEQVYVFQTTTRSFTRWNAPTWGCLGPVFEWENAFSAGGLTVAYGMPASMESATLSPTTSTYSMPAFVVTDTSVTDSSVTALEGPNGDGFFTAHLRTPYYFYDKPSNFKRLYWWGLDCDIRDTVFNTLIYNEGALSTALWGDLPAANSTWGDEYDQGDTWADPVPGSFTSGDYAIGNTVSPRRAMVKFLKPLRFRQVMFDVQFQTDGSFGQAAEIYRVATYVNVRQTVSAKVS